LVERRARGSYLNHLGMILHARVARYLSQAQAAIDAIGAQKPASGPPVIDRITRTQIRALLAIIQHGSLSGAAHALGLSVGSLQRGTRELEAILQVALLERDAAGLRLNRDGLAFGRRMKLALQEIDRGVAEIEIAKRISGPRIVVGTMPFGSALMLGSVLENIHRLHPQATVRTVTATSAQIVDYLREGEVDLVFGLMPPSHDDTDLVVEAIARTPYAIIVRRDHPLMRLTRVTIDDLRAYGWVVGEAGSHRLESFRQMFRGRDLPC
jgi:LysR family transcriptional regulator, regulator for genes of the gallate degradation pathway